MQRRLPGIELAILGADYALFLCANIVSWRISLGALAPRHLRFARYEQW